MPWGLLILLAAGLILGWAMLVVYTAYVLSHPTRRGYAFAVARNLPGDPSEVTCGDPPRGGLEYTEWTFRSRNRDLPVWDVRALDPAGPTIIITHGWGDSRVVMLSRLAALAPLASRVVMWDLPAHGDAPKGGFTLGAREHDDLLELIARVSPVPESQSGRAPLILYGSSLGAGLGIVAASELARRFGGASPITALISEAPYRIPPVPARNVLRMRGLPYRSNLLPAMALLSLRFGQGLSWAISPTAGTFDRVQHARRLPASTPLLVLHGSIDQVCPLDDARAIAATAPSARLVVIENAGHNNLWSDAVFTSQCTSAVREFLASLSSTPHHPHSSPAAS